MNQPQPGITAWEAANLINVSLPYLVKLLESGKISFTRIGIHRRVRSQDVYVTGQKNNFIARRLCRTV